MTYICILENVGTGTFSEEFFSADTLAEAAKVAVEDRIGEVTAIDVTPIGGTHYHTVFREVDPEKFWLAMLAHCMTDNEEYGWGNSQAEALDHAMPEAIE